MSNFRKAPIGVMTLALLAGALGSGCAPLVIGGAVVGSTLVATDRRTSGIQLEDQTIEIKASSKISKALGGRSHVNVNTYNRVVLLTGEVASEADRAEAQRLVSEVENVQTVVNELAVMGNASLTSRANDTLIQAKVKATFVEAKDVMANAVVIVVERGNVYLMGMVTEREGHRMADLASGISGVAKVVKVFQLLTEEELARRQPPAPVYKGSPEGEMSQPRVRP